MTQLAWIGLGNMGRGMAKNIVEKGELGKPLVLFNRTVKKAQDFSKTLPEGKSVVAESIEDAVSKADIIFTCLGDDAAIRETFDAALKVDVGGKIFVECSTIHPDATNALAEEVQTKGAQFVACPVFGPPALAESGQLVCVLAGPAAVTQKVKPYTKGVMGREIIDFSNQAPGKATLLKVIGNSFIFNMVETLAQGHTVAETSGLGPENLHKFIETMFPGPFAAYSNRMMGGDYFKREEPLFGVDLARKDIRHVLELAKSSGARMENIEVADRHLTSVQKHMGSRGDIAGIYGAVRQESGLEFENGPAEKEP